MKQLTLILLMLFILGQALPSQALPGWELHKSWTGQGKDPFYLNHAWLGSCCASWAIRNLNTKQQLIWQLSYWDEWHAVSDIETLYIVDRRCESQGFELLLINTAPGLCWPQNYFLPAHPDNQQLKHFIRKIYRDQARLVLKDLHSAQLILAGKRYFWQDARLRHKLAQPIEFYAWRGQIYDYVISPIGFSVTYRRSGYFSALRDKMREDIQLLKKLSQANQ